MSDNDLTVLSLPIVGGALVDVPVFEKHSRGRNWMAKIQPNANAPGGWDRSFAPHGRGDDMKYLVSDVFVRDVLEFGADYVTSVGKKRMKRKYAVVVSVDSDYLDVILFDSPLEAWQESRVVSPPKATTPEVSEAEKLIALMTRLPVGDRLTVLGAFCACCGSRQPEVGPLCSCDSQEEVKPE
jgi:hypothetical protein